MEDKSDVGRALTAHSVVSSKEEEVQGVRLSTSGECCGLDGPCLPVVRILVTFTLDYVEGVEPPKGGAH